jgi:DNA-binding response OmpR family regulator
MNTPAAEVMLGRVGAGALRILVVAGDRLSIETIARSLEQNGFTVLYASDAVAAVEAWRRDAPDVVLVDVDLPRDGGFEVCRQIREASRTPVIMVAEDAVESDVVRGYASGADDFVVRPFGSEQLVWRIRAIHGRYTSAASLDQRPYLAVGDLMLDLDRHSIVLGSARVPLTPTEFRIFRKLVANPGKVVCFSRLVDTKRPGKTNQPDGADAVKTHVSNLRRKLRELGGYPRHIDAVAGQGYLLSLRQPSRRLF